MHLHTKYQVNISKHSEKKWWQLFYFGITEWPTWVTLYVPATWWRGHKNITHLVQEVSVWLFLDLGFNFHLEFCQYKFRNLLWYFCINKINFLYCLNKAFFSHSMYFNIDYNCLVNQLYYKMQIICKKWGKSAKWKKATLISFWTRGRAISADIGWEFRPLRLVWWALRVISSASLVASVVLLLMINRAPLCMGYKPLYFR
jgi:hypothetical protein